MLFYESMIPPHIADKTKAENPNNFGGFWSPGWGKSEPKKKSLKKHQAPLEDIDDKDEPLIEIKTF